MPKPWMIYGANGYTGELIAWEAGRPALLGRPARFWSSRAPDSWRRATQSVAFASADWQRSPQTSFPGAG